MRFDQLALSDDILDALDDMHFEQCTPIQEQAIPLIIDGHDLIACAQTGTGKTAAYLLPVLDRLADDIYYEEHNGRRDHRIRCVIMSPTRELARQIDSLLQGFAYYLPISSLAVYGGTDGAGFSTQKTGLSSGADVVIASPGRLLDHIAMGYVDLSHVTCFILDEADRMLDMGFYDDIRQITARLPRNRQTLMFSATMPDKTRRLAQEILHNPKEISLEVSRPTDKIDQSAVVCHETQKTPILLHLFKEVSARRVIIFASSKIKVKELARELKRAKYNVKEMHSDLEQAERDEVMRQFRARNIDIIVATDILSRGIDIDNISMVVNYDVPHECEDYVHRIGRTARADADGVAVTFVSDKDQRKFGMIERFLGYAVRKRDVDPSFGETPEYRPGKKGHGKRKGGYKGSPNKKRGVGKRRNPGKETGNSSKGGDAKRNKSHGLSERNR